MNSLTYNLSRMESDDSVQRSQDQFGFKLAARLSAGSRDLPHDISERLRVARQQAVAQRKRTQLVTSTKSATAVFGSGASASMSFDDEGLNLWSRLASFLPLIALVVGLITISVIQNDLRARELAEVDTALLVDDLPPAAYADAGFAQFLKLHADYNATHPGEKAAQ
ncbi:MAG: hypothetical protein RL535_723 [Pseudomonadota bacterium]